MVIGAILKRKLALLGLIIIAVFTAAAVLAPWLAPYDPTVTPDITLLHPLAPDTQFWFGTDLLGRDFLSRLIYGARATLIIGVLANGIAVAIGALIGVTAGYLRGQVGSLLMRFTDLMMAFPALLLAILLAAMFNPSIWIVVMVIAMVSWVKISLVD